MTRFSKQQYSGEEIEGWFNAVLKRSDPRPSKAALDKLVRSFQVELNRADNLERERLGITTLSLMKDVSLDQEIRKRADEISQLAKQMIPAIDNLENFLGGYVWRHPTRDIPLDEVRQLAIELAFFAAPERQHLVFSRGKPLVPWKNVTQNFCT